MLYVRLKNVCISISSYVGRQIIFILAAPEGKLVDEVSDSLDEDVEWYFFREGKVATLSYEKR